MQNTFSINLLALVNGEPRTLTLKQALRVYVEHRLEVIVNGVGLETTAFGLR